MNAFRQCVSLPSSQWIATGYALAMTRCAMVRCVCHCEEDRMDDAAIHRVSRDAVVLPFRLLDHSGSPRAFTPRDEKVGKEWGCAVRFQHDLCHCEERAKRGTRQSTVCNGRVRTMRFASLLTVDRHGLTPSR
jgi:hypothetical protein